MKKLKRHRKKVFVENDPCVKGPAFVMDRANLIIAYNYHNENSEIKKAREWVDEYITKSGQSEKFLQQFKQVDDGRIPMWLCVHARLYLRGTIFVDENHTKMQAKINELIDTVKPTKTKLQYIPEFGNPTIARVESLFDHFYRHGYVNTSFQLYDFFKTTETSQADVRAVLEYYIPLQEEITLLAAGDKEVKEGYPHLTAKHIKHYKQVVDEIISDCKKYTETERKIRKIRKPRAKKIKSADQLTSRVKFKTEDTNLKIASVSPTKIVGAQVVWLYNTKYKKLSMLVAEENNQLTIKGTTVIGFCEKNSKAKTIRKPEQNLTNLMSLSRIAMQKEFLKLKTRDQVPNGRLSSDTIILKVT